MTSKFGVCDILQHFQDTKRKRKDNHEQLVDIENRVYNYEKGFRNEVAKRSCLFNWYHGRPLNKKSSKRRPGDENLEFCFSSTTAYRHLDKITFGTEKAENDVGGRGASKPDEVQTKQTTSSNVVEEKKAEATSKEAVADEKVVAKCVEAPSSKKAKIQIEEKTEVEEQPEIKINESDNRSPMRLSPVKSQSKQRSSVGDVIKSLRLRNKLSAGTPVERKKK